MSIALNWYYTVSLKMNHELDIQSVLEICNSITFKNIPSKGLLNWEFVKMFQQIYVGCRKAIREFSLAKFLILRVKQYRIKKHF